MASQRLYIAMGNRGVRGFCYSVSFDLCQILRKGEMEFVAIKMLKPRNRENIDEDEEPYEYTMHVLFVNNGWAFDTYSARQFPLQRMHEILGGEVYRRISFEEIRGVEYDDFRRMHWLELQEWSEAHNCYCSFGKGLEP